MTRILFDTMILVGLARQDLRGRERDLFEAANVADNVSFASAASLWEVAIKTRLGKLDPAIPLDALWNFFEEIGLRLLTIDHRHALAAVEPEPPTRDPFDRMLLAQCAVENMRLVTTDRALAAHPLAWRP